MRNMMLGALLGALVTSGAMAQEKPAATTIQVLGSGSVEEAPSVAKISFSLRGEGKASDDALRALVARKDAVEGALGSLDGAKVRLQTGNVEISEVRGSDCHDADEDEDKPRLSTGPCAIQGYVATMGAWADVSPVAMAGTLSGLASRAGASNVRLSDFRIADPDVARRGAMAAAVANGREQAEGIAAASGGKLGRLVRVTDPDSSYDEDTDGIVTVTGSLARRPATAPVLVTIAPKPITTSARLVLVYEIVR